VVTISRRRYLAGNAAIEASNTSRWSAVVFDPAEPLRNSPASGSVVLSQ
jgi:hypothetical protein